MTTEPTPAKVRFSDQLGHADEVQPLVARLEEGGCGEYCDSLGRESSAALQSLQESYGQLLAENVRLRAALEVSQAATNAAVSKAQFQASTNAELNALHDQVRRLKASACARFNDEFGA